MSFEAATAHHGDIGTCVDECECARQPLRLKDTIPVEELHKLAFGELGPHLLVTCVPSTRRRQAPVGGQDDGPDPKPPRRLCACIRGRGIRADDPRRDGEDGTQAAFQT